MSVAITLLETQKLFCQTKITDIRAKMSKAENAYESLRLFKPVVEKSQGNFNTINSKKGTILDDVKAVKNCRTATKYYEGMKSVLNGIGAKIVGIAYVTVLLSIGSKLQSYLNTINGCDADIKSYEREIVKIDAKIKAEKEKEAASGGMMI
jgi:hypothetical protein